MCNTLKKAVLVTMTMFVVVGCGSFEKIFGGKKGGGGGGGDVPVAEDGGEENNGVKPGSLDPYASDSYDLAVGCTGEERTAGLLNATGLVLSRLPANKQAAILAAQGRLPGDRDVQLSTSAHITNSLNLAAEIGESFAAAWSGDKTTPTYASISAMYGTFPGGNRLDLMLFGKSFYERVYGGSADGESVAAMGTLLDSLDDTAVDPSDQSIEASVGDVGKVVALVTAIGSSMCMN